MNLFIFINELWTYPVLVWNLSLIGLKGIMFWDSP
jgi:hypothetical protein